MVLNVDYVYLDKVFYKEYGKDYPQSDVKKWNFNIKIKNSHNCYAYALNKISHKLKDKPQPGLFSHTHNSHSCKNYKIAIKNDAPNIIFTNFNKKCPKTFHKIFMAIDDKPNGDYHFYRQNNDGTWSHKPGRTDVTTLNAKDKPILNPLVSDRNYIHNKYTKPCFFACVNKHLSRAHSEEYK